MSNNVHIRNFSIIAHIDHGKSTLADRFIQLCGGLSTREMKEQVLDSMELERERGITIKAQCVRLFYLAQDNITYQLNLIDTPGHVDFSYEVSRSLAACEGALLVVDAAQGVEAQSVANCYTAINQNVEIIPVINKIDLVQADIENVCMQIENIIGIDATDALKISAKLGTGIVELLEAIIKRIPAPKVDNEAPLQALIIDSWFDSYLGIVSLIRVVNGCIRKNDKIVMMSTGETYNVEGVGYFTPKRQEVNVLYCGEVGYIIAGVKNIDGAKVGDTITTYKNQAINMLPGFQMVVPKVFAGIFPIDSKDYVDLRESLGKLKLNDASIQYEPESSTALGFGFRCGFLGLLHMEIIKERLEREYDLDLIMTAPTVVFEVILKDHNKIKIDNPSKLPDLSQILELLEPMVVANILVPKEYLGAVITLCQEKRGVQQNLTFIGEQANLTYNIPMNEVVLDFFDRLKSISRGYASLDYHFLEFVAADLVKLDILIAGEKVDALSLITHRTNAYYKGRELVEKLKELIPRQMFEVAIQAAIGGQIIARSTVKALRKNVIAKCYGGDITRKKKLLEKQKEGKKRMKSIGKVDVPQEAFLAILKIDEGKK